MEMQKENNKKFSLKLVQMATTVTVATLVLQTKAFAEDKNVSGALKNAGITSTNLDADKGGLFESLKSIVYIIMGIGGLWGVAWLVIGGMLLAGSGSNPQKRSGGLAALGVAALGIFVIYKAWDIAGWAVNLGK